MSRNGLRYFVGAVICGLVPLVPTLPVSADVRQAQTVATARPLAALDAGPPVMRQAADFESSAPVRTYAPSAPARTRIALSAPSNPRLFREVFGFAFASSLGDPTIGYPSWNFSLLSTVAYFGVHVTWTGDFSQDSALSTWNNPSGPVPGFIAAAHAQGTKVVLTIVMDDSTAGTPNMCSALQRGSVTITNTVNQVVAKGIDGVNVDYESNNSSCTDPSSGAVQSSQSLFTTFVRNLRAALPSGSYLTVDTYSGSAGYRSGSTYLGFFDIGALANYADAFFVMAYDMEYANASAAPISCPSFCIGPTAPLTTYLYNDSRASAEYRAVVAGSKVIMGIPYYGRKECVGGYTPSNAPPNAVGDSVAADGYLDASTEDGYSANSDYHIHREGRDTAGNERWDTFTSSTAGCTRELYWDDTTSLGLKYDLIINDHLRGAGIFALNYGGGAPELWSLINLKFGQCSNAVISADHTSPQIPGTQVTFTGGAFCAGTPQFRFWMSPPSGGWSVTQAYSTTNTAAWNTTGLPLGTYRWEVDARNLGSSVSYDTAAIMPMRLALCVTPTLTPDHAPPQLPGTAITFTASATCTSTPEYRFWLKPPGGAWSIAQDYGAATTFKWTPAAGAYGTFDVEVDARTQGTTVTYESTQSMTYAVTSCIGPSLTADKTSPQPTGTQIGLAGSATCDGTPQYRYTITSPDGSSSVVQDFSGTSTYAWHGGGPAGSYSVALEARSSAAPLASAVMTSLPFELDACTGAALATSATSPQIPGTAITLTGSATCTGTATYRFWLRSPGAAWHVVQDYSPAATYSWNTTSLPLGDYGLEVDVRNSGATSNYESSTNQIFTLAAQACTTPTLSSDMTSPQGTGATVTWTSSTSACPTPVYRFWLMPPGGSWTIAQDYGSSPTFKWAASGAAGSYGVEVDVRDVSRPVTYDAVANTTFSLTACTSAAVTTDLTSPQSPGATVTLTGSATCAGTAQYRFWVRPPGGAWTMVRDFATANTFAWRTTLPGGTYGLEVDVRDVGAAAPYETTANITFGVTAPCNVPSLSTDVASPQAVGTTVTFTGAATGCPTPQFRFWVRPPGGSWAVQQDYGAATFKWSTAGLAIGTYQFEVDARNQGSVVSYDAARGAFFALTSPPCATAGLTANPASPGGTGTAVVLTGAATGCPAPEYRFWVRPPGGAWSIVRDYNTTPTFSWPGGAAGGDYALEVDVRAHGSTVSYDAVKDITYTVSPCAAAQLSADHTSPQPIGTTVVFTGSATCLGTPQYRFWLQPPGGRWTIVQDYGSGATFSWNTTGLAAGTYRVEVDVRDTGASATYETVAWFSFTIQ